MSSNIVFYQEILDTINKRQSTRKFSDEQIAPDLLQTLDNICKTFKPYDSVRSVLVTSNLTEIFTMIFGIKFIKNPAAAILFISKKNMRFELGYTGEFIILSATGLGIDTCWVAGTFNKKVANSIDGLSLQDDEEILCVCPIGYAEDKTLREKDRLDINIIAPKFSLFPSWIKSAVQAARVAPSATNTQPCRYEMRENDLKISISTKDKMRLLWNAESRQIDLGIAAAHIFVVASLNGVKGKFIKSKDGMSVIFVAEK